MDRNFIKQFQGEGHRAEEDIDKPKVSKSPEKRGANSFQIADPNLELKVSEQKKIDEEKLKEARQRLFGDTSDEKTGLEVTEKDWKWKEFKFDTGVIYLTPDAKKYDDSARRDVISDARNFIKNKPEIFHSGTDGSVYLSESGKFMIKEQIIDGRDMLRRHAKIEKLIKKKDDFPKDVQLIDYLAVVEPPYELDEYGRREGPDVFEGYETEVAVGAGEWTRKGEIASYVVMPFIKESVDLAKLGQYKSDMTEDDTEKFVENMIAKGIVGGKTEIADFAKRQGERIQDAISKALEIDPDFKFRDLATHNIMMKINDGVPEFYLIDL